MKLLFVTLGCAKNTVDSERMLYLLTRAGYQTTADPAEAEIAVVNTCAFLESARQEAIDQILELALLKIEGKLHTLVVAGCMAQLIQGEITEQMPEVDGVVGCGRTEEIVEQVEAAVAKRSPLAVGNLDAAVVVGDRVLSESPFTAYLKISEGCDNRCAYCLIPSIRGPFRSAPIDALVQQAASLAENGVRELIVVSQDTTRYGRDLYGKPHLCELLRRLCGIDALRWIRLHYLHPDGIDDDLIALVASCDKIVKYLDIPIQHADGGILAAMNRSPAPLDALFTRLRQRIDGLVLRTTVMVGFPGETQEAFARLYQFLEKHKVERAGVFVYSREEGTAAAEMPNQVEAETALKRQEALQLLQAEVQDGWNQTRFGTTMTVLCEGFDRLTDHYYGRSYADSPDVDGKVFFTSEKRVAAGDFVEIAIESALDGDLLGVHLP